MANTPSAKKRILQTAKRTAVNAARKSRIRTFLRKVEEAIRGGDAEAAREALKVAQPEIMRGAARGVLHANTASRKVARLAHRVKAMQPI
jgi:small subunit ribosomal protein S20